MSEWWFNAVSVTEALKAAEKITHAFNSVPTKI